MSNVVGNSSQSNKIMYVTWVDALGKNNGTSPSIYRTDTMFGQLGMANSVRHTQWVYEGHTVTPIQGVNTLATKCQCHHHRQGMGQACTVRINVGRTIKQCNGHRNTIPPVGWGVVTTAKVTASAIMSTSSRHHLHNCGVPNVCGVCVG